MKMKQGELLNIQILPQADDPSFEQRESGMAHTSYREETAFLSAIQQGDVERVKQLLGQYIKSGIVVGRLSTNSIRQMQYWAVCCVTLGTRYAIQGGLNEMQAFNLSDRYIMQIDQFTSGEEIISFLNQIVLEITGLVHENARGNCPAAIRKCLDYIDRNLHESIRLADLAALVNLSGDYLSKLFKKHVGKPLREYIIERKLETAKGDAAWGMRSEDGGLLPGLLLAGLFYHLFPQSLWHHAAPICRPVWLRNSTPPQKHPQDAFAAAFCLAH